MGGCRCSFRGCKSATKVSGDLHFFHYPVKHRERCNEWIKNAWRPEFFNLPDDQLRNKVVCDLHFEPKFFTNELRKRLVHNAIPTLYTCTEEELNESNSLKNVQILPANEEGTVFTLDTDNMQHRSSNVAVSTYSFRNGALVPICEKNATDQILYTIENEGVQLKQDPSYQESNENYLFLDSNKSESEQVSDGYQIVFNGNANTTQTYLERKPQNHNNQTRSALQQKMEVVYITESPTTVFAKPDANTEVVKAKVKQIKKEVIKEIPDKLDNKKPLKTVPLKRKYINQLKNHSREIASIKRIIQAGMGRRNKFNIGRLKTRVPSSLLGVLSLNLYNRKSNFTKEELEFLTTTYSASPELYKMLNEKLRWNLPEVSVVRQLLKK